MKEKNNQPETTFSSIGTENISFQERVQREIEKKNATKKESLAKALIEKKKERVEKEEYFQALRNKFDYDEIRKKLKSIIENPQLRILVENMGKEAGLKETRSPISTHVSDFSEKDLYLVKKDKNFSEEEFIFKHTKAGLIFRWGEYWVQDSDDDIAGHFDGHMASRCVFTLEIKIDSSGSVVISQYGWDMCDRRYQASPRKYFTEVINSLDELFEKIISAYIDSLPKLKEEAEIFNKEEEGEKRIESRPQRLKDYKETLLRRKKELIEGSLTNKVKNALGLMDYENHFTEQELKDLEDIENGKDLVDFK